MTPSGASDKDATVRYVSALFFELLDSIRYARDNFNPRYRSLEPRVKLRATYELRRISELAAEYFCTSNYDGTADATEKLKARAIEHALDIMEGG